MSGDVFIIKKRCYKRKKKKLLFFTSSIAFLKELPSISCETEIYIDSNLSAGEPKGEDLAKELFDRGYRNLFLTTGYSPDRFSGVSWIKKVTGKEPPWI